MPIQNYTFLDETLKIYICPDGQSARSQGLGIHLGLTMHHEGAVLSSPSPGHTSASALIWLSPSLRALFWCWLHAPGIDKQRPVSPHSRAGSLFAVCFPLGCPNGGLSVETWAPVTHSTEFSYRFLYCFHFWKRNFQKDLTGYWLYALYF